MVHFQYYNFMLESEKLEVYFLKEQKLAIFKCSTILYSHITLVEFTKKKISRIGCHIYILYTPLFIGIYCLVMFCDIFVFAMIWTPSQETARRLPSD